MTKLGIKAVMQIIVHVAVLRPWVKLFLGLNITGNRNLKALDRYIIISNHNSHLDVFLLFYLLPLRSIPFTHPVADREYFSRHRLVFRLVEFFFNPIWVARGQTGRKEEPFKAFEERLNQGHNIILFPEGTRGKPGEMQHFKSGIGRLVVRYPNIPVVPVFLFGPERALPKRSFLPLPFWNHLVVGPPQRIHGSHRNITQSLERFLHELSCSVSAGRHKRACKIEKIPQSIAFLGIDGSGKSSLSKHVAWELSETAVTCLISDDLVFYEHGNPKGVQPLLTEKVRKYIGSRAKRARSLKGYKIPKLAELLLRNHLHHEARRWYIPDFILLDGSPLLNMIAWAVIYWGDRVNKEVCTKAIAVLSGKDRELNHHDPILSNFPELRLLRRFKIRKMVIPDIVVFLDVSTSEACRRIEERGEARQVHETEEKLGKLREAYLMVCEVVRKHYHINTLIIDGEKDRELIAQEALEFIKNIRRQAQGKS